MNHLAVDTFSYWLKEALDSAVAHGDINMVNFYTYKAIEPSTGQPPQLELPYVAISIPAGAVSNYHRQKANVYSQAVIDRTRIAIQIGGRQLVTVGNLEMGGFDVDVLPLITVIRNFVENNTTLSAPPALTDFANRMIGVFFDQPADQPFRVKDHEGHIFYVMLEYMTKTKEH